MPAYITLVKLTDQGTRNIKEWPARIAEAMQVAGQFGVNFQCWMTMGPWDFVGLAEAPNDETIGKVNLSIAARGDVQTLTMRAFSVEEIQRIVQDVR